MISESAGVAGIDSQRSHWKYDRPVNQPATGSETFDSMQASAISSAHLPGLMITAMLALVGLTGCQGHQYESHSQAKAACEKWMKSGPMYTIEAGAKINPRGPRALQSFLEGLERDLKIAKADKKVTSSPFVYKPEPKLVTYLDPVSYQDESAQRQAWREEIAAAENRLKESVHSTHDARVRALQLEVDNTNQRLFQAKESRLPNYLPGKVSRHYLRGCETEYMRRRRNSESEGERLTYWQGYQYTGPIKAAGKKFSEKGPELNSRDNIPARQFTHPPSVL